MQLLPGVLLLGLGAAVGGGAVAWGARLWIRRQLRRLHAAERRARAAERMAEIGAMTGGLAHEIKNPLSTIGLNAQLLAESIEDLEAPEAEKGRLLSRIKALRREVDRLRDILIDFLEFAGKVHLEPRPTDANMLVEELVDFYLPEAQRQGVWLRCELAPGPLTVRLDPKLIKQALLNLMLNATQAMSQQHAQRLREGAEGVGGGGPGAPSIPAGAAGELILRTARLPDRDAPGGEVVRIDVIDTGPGISAETLGRLFQPYFTTKAGGTGLGLATSRRLVEEHAGRIEVASTPGAGSDFAVVLPVDGPGADADRG